MTCARKILLSLALVILGLGFSSNAYADINTELPIYFGVSGTSVYCSIPPYNSSSFGSFSIGSTIGGTDYQALTPTSGQGICTGSLDAPGNITNAGTNYVNLYNGAGGTNAYGHYVLYCTSPVSNAGDCSASNSTATTTQFIVINEPLGGTISTSTTVIFDYDYYYNSGADIEYTTAGIEVTDLTNQSTIVTPTSPIIASGFNTFRKSVSLLSGHQYLWKPVLSNASSTISGNVNIFNVVSNPFPYSPLEQPLATSTATSSTPLQFLNLVSLVQNKHPIAYIPQTITLLQSQATLTGTSSFPTLQFDFTSTRLGSTTLNLTTVDMFSTSTITYFFGATQIALFKQVITAVVWVGVVLFLIRDIRRTLFIRSM